jgi:hypothetical protein
MFVFPVAELLPILQIAIGPVILISGVGLLLLSMTNRLGRAIDRSRILAIDIRNANEGDRERFLAQLHIILARARLIRLAILFATLSVLLAAFLIIILFVTALFRLEDAWLISALFMSCMVSLIVSLAIFLQDINLSLSALKREVLAVEDY